MKNVIANTVACLCAAVLAFVVMIFVLAAVAENNKPTVDEAIQTAITEYQPVHIYEAEIIEIKK